MVAATVLAAPAWAANCPGNPNALGTSRTLVVDPMEHPRIGTMQYAETLPLRDHEVVLTFDDGPLPPHSNQVLKILASECVKATFFIIGRMAHQFPEGVRRVRAAGHTIGTHSENHPLHFNKMTPERIRQEIDLGIAHTAEALGDPSAVAPFFRVPGLRRGRVMEDYLASKGIQLWSADFPADDWRHISADQVYNYAISRIEAKRRGILLLHDIQARTVAALPRILQTLKARGYKIVHVVPATPTRPRTPTQPWQWQLHPPARTVALAHWPAVPRFLFVGTGTLPIPQLTASDLHDGRLLRPPRSRRLVRGPARSRIDPLWPRRTTIRVALRAPVLPAPGQAIFAQLDKTHTQNFGVAALPRPKPVAQPALDDASIGRMISTDIGSAGTVAPQPRLPGSVPIAGPSLRQPAPAAN
ncbi:MAG: polysaccharide deacetylase family protein [Xanthobacteraceae bacterium]|nr:polysaccharide deacetylase family protein [Xanthobacteraceae bacterium]